MTIRLTPRLYAIAQWVPSGGRFADIGTDHAYLPAWLLQQGVISRAIAADLREDPLNRARATAVRCGLAAQMDIRRSNGLEALAPHEADCIVIAGMGGENIRAILTAAPWSRENVRLILQPQTNLPQLRLWLTESGYRILSDRCVREEERWYTLLLVTGGEDETLWTPGSLLAGTPAQWSSRDGAERQAYLNFLLRRTRQQLQGMSRAAVPDAKRQARLRQACQELEQWLQEEAEP